MKLIAKYNGRCHICGFRIIVGESIQWNKDTKETVHFVCYEHGPPEVAGPDTSDYGDMSPWDFGLEEY